MSDLTPAEAAAILRESVAALSARGGAEFGEMVPAASAERTAALAEKFERVETAWFNAGDIATLDAWIRAADGFTLHDDPAEAGSRAEIARRLRAVREMIAPPADLLTPDPRDAEEQR